LTVAAPVSQSRTENRQSTMVPVRSLPLAALITLIAAPTFAQSGGGYDVTWYTVDGGGITYCTSTDYKVGGTVGQPDAGSVSGEAYVVRGGFWQPLGPQCTLAAVPLV
jgi:hypothetical protein